MRWLFPILLQWIRRGVIVISLLGCLATIGLWVRSYWHWDSIRYVRPIRPDGGSYQISTGDSYDSSARTYDERSWCLISSRGSIATGFWPPALLSNDDAGLTWKTSRPQYDLVLVLDILAWVESSTSVSGPSSSFGHRRLTAEKASQEDRRQGSIRLRGLGFALNWARLPDPDNRIASRIILIPHWFAVLVTAIPPMAWVVMQRRGRRRRVRQKKGLCIGCGYDLRASPERCPECGMANKAPATLT